MHEFYAQILRQLAPTLQKIVTSDEFGEKIGEFMDEEGNIALPKELIQAFKEFLEKFLEFLGKKDFKVDDYHAGLLLINWFTIGIPTCLCAPRPCPCKEFLEKDICICGLFQKIKK